MSKSCIRALALGLSVLFSAACEEAKQKPAQIHAEPVPGKIEIFNSCGMPGAASEAKDYLRRYGFDVLSAQTDPQWSNYEETIVAIRNPHWQGDSLLRAAIDTKNFLILQDTLSGIIDATVFLGKDYAKAMKIR